MQAHAIGYVRILPTQPLEFGSSRFPRQKAKRTIQNFSLNDRSISISKGTPSDIARRGLTIDDLRSPPKTISRILADRGVALKSFEPPSVIQGYALKNVHLGENLTYQQKLLIYQAFQLLDRRSKSKTQGHEHHFFKTWPTPQGLKIDLITDLSQTRKLVIHGSLTEVFTADLIKVDGAWQVSIPASSNANAEKALLKRIEGLSR